MPESSPVVTPTPDPAASSRTRRQLALLTALATLLRVAWVLVVRTNPYSDYKTYLFLATGLAGGHSLPPNPWPPGFAYFLAPFVRIFGDHAPLLASLTLALLGGLTTLPCFALGRRLRGPRTGLAAAGLWAVWPGLIVFGSCLASDLLFTDLVVVGAWLLVRRARTPRLGPLLAGVALGAATLVRGAGLAVVFPALLAVVYLDRNRWRSLAKTAGLFAVGFAAAASFWLVQSRAIYGHTLLVPPQGGQNFLAGNNPSSLGIYLGVDTLLHVPVPGSPLPSADLDSKDRAAVRWGLRFLADDPVSMGLATVRKVADVFKGEDLLRYAAVDHPLALAAHPALRSALDAGHTLQDALLDLYVFLVLSLGVAGLCRRSLWRSEGAILGAVVAAQVGMLGLLWPQPRYHLPAVALLLPVAAAELARLWRTEPARRRRVFALAAIAPALTALVLFVLGPAAGALAARRARPALVIATPSGPELLRFDHQGSEPPPDMDYMWGNYNQTFDRVVFRCRDPHATECTVVGGLALGPGRYAITAHYALRTPAKGTVIFARAGAASAEASGASGILTIVADVSAAGQTLEIGLRPGPGTQPGVIVDTVVVTQTIPSL